MGKWKGPPHEDISRCGAKTRQGRLCGHYSMPNGRCRYHGGKSTGAKNPITKHGLYSKDTARYQSLIHAMLKESKRTIELIRT